MPGPGPVRVRSGSSTEGRSAGSRGSGEGGGKGKPFPNLRSNLDHDSKDASQGRRIEDASARPPHPQSLCLRVGLLRVSAGFVQELLQDFLADVAPSARKKKPKKHSEIGPKSIKMGPKWLPNGSRDPLRGGSGTKRKKEAAQGATITTKWRHFGTPKSAFFLLLASGRVSGVAPNRRLSLRSSASRLFRFSALLGAPLCASGGLWGSL